MIAEGWNNAGMLLTDITGAGGLLGTLVLLADLAFTPEPISFTLKMKNLNNTGRYHNTCKF